MGLGVKTTACGGIACLPQDDACSDNHCWIRQLLAQLVPAICLSQSTDLWTDWYIFDLSQKITEGLVPSRPRVCSITHSVTASATNYGPFLSAFVQLGRRKHARCAEVGYVSVHKDWNQACGPLCPSSFLSYHMGLVKILLQFVSPHSFSRTPEFPQSYDQFLQRFDGLQIDESWD